MTPEKALYHKLMLTAGLTDQYEADLLHTLETEDTYSDIILELSYCQSDLNKTISVLHNYTLDKTIDENAVFDMVMNDLRNRYTANSLTSAESVDVMHTIAHNSEKIYLKPWCDMEYMYDYYSDVECGLTTWDNFHQCFESFIQTGEFGTPDEYRLVKHKRTKKQWIELSIFVLLEILFLAIISYYLSLH